MTQPKTCALCGREVRVLTEHHLIPRTTHKQVTKRTGVPKAELLAQTVDVCEPCHKTIHRQICEKELARSYNTIESLLEHPGIATFVAWVKRQPDRHIHIR